MSGTLHPEALRLIEGDLHEAFARGSKVETIPGFRLYLWPRPDIFYRNVALPLPGGPAWEAAVPRLIRAFETTARRPRVELFPDLHPGLREALERVGLRVQQAAPVMILEGERLRRRSEARRHPLCWLTAQDDPRFLALVLHGIAHAFDEGDAPPAPGEVETLRERLADGFIQSAVWVEDGRPLAGASLVGRGAIAELAGVWTAVDRRRRGHGRAVCEALIARFARRGGTLLWLSAASPAGRPLYDRLGFHEIGTQLDMMLPRGTP